MYKVEHLKKKSLSKLIIFLNTSYKDCNKNTDFIDTYNDINFLSKRKLRKQVYIFYENQHIKGFLWFEREGEREILIKDIILPSFIDNYKNFVTKKLNKYDGINLIYNSNIMDRLINSYPSYIKNTATVELEFCLDVYEIPNHYDNSIKYEVLKKGVQEDLRCKLQNEIFSSNKRIPLSVEDIKEDEKQSYYLNDMAILLKKNEVYIGYGQIIKDKDKGIPLIVNFGILPQYRGLGYGKSFLFYLMTLAKEKGYESIKIKVDKDNIPAYNLYTRCGFMTKRETHNLTLI